MSIVAVFGQGRQDAPSNGRECRCKPRQELPKSDRAADNNDGGAWPLSVGLRGQLSWSPLCTASQARHWVTLSMNVSRGNCFLQRQPNPTSTGFNYWSLGCKLSSLFVWSAELSWLVNSLLRLPDQVEFSRFEKSGLYPIDSDVGSNGGLVWYIHVGSNGRALALRRLSGSFRRDTSDGSETVDQTRYFHYQRSRRFPHQVWISEQEVLSDQFRRFAAECDYAFRQMQTEAQVAVGRDVASHEVFRRVILSRDGMRRVPLLPGWPTDGVNFDVVDRPLIDLVLEHCQSRTSSEIVSDLRHRLDEQSIRHLLPWTVRYSDDVVRGGYFFHVSSQSGQSARYQASRDKTLFLSDPVLASLVPVTNLTPPDKSLAHPIPLPQYERPPFDRARREGWSAGDRQTSFGVTPTPTETRTAILRRFAALPTGMRRYRWRILQLLDLQSAALCNSTRPTACGVLATQRVALLIADATGLFAPETVPAESVNEVTSLLKQAIDRYRAVLAGGAKAVAALQPSELPKFPNTEFPR